MNRSILFDWTLNVLIALKNAFIALVFIIELIKIRAQTISIIDFFVSFDFGVNCIMHSMKIGFNFAGSNALRCIKPQYLRVPPCVHCTNAVNQHTQFRTQAQKQRSICNVQCAARSHVLCYAFGALFFCSVAVFWFFCFCSRNFIILNWYIRTPEIYAHTHNNIVFYLGIVFFCCCFTAFIRVQCD